MKARLALLVLGCTVLGGCLDPLIAAGVELGGRALIAGIGAAASDSSEPNIAAYCWNPEKQSASTSSSPNCWNPEVRITEEEYEKFRRSGVAPVVNANRSGPSAK